MKRKLRSLFLAVFCCFTHEAHAKPKRFQLFVQGISRRLARFFSFFGYDVRMKTTGEYYFQLGDRRLEKKRTKRILEALNR